jgi:hypothetical protein
VHSMQWSPRKICPRISNRLNLHSKSHSCKFTVMILLTYREMVQADLWGNATVSYHPSEHSDL